LDGPLFTGFGVEYRYARTGNRGAGGIQHRAAQSCRVGALAKHCRRGQQKREEMVTV
jgi:hypothetical protein